MINTLLLILPLLLGWLLDFIFGDPSRLPHPVVWFGKMISWGEHRLNKGNHRMAKGAMMAIVLILMVFFIVCGLKRLVPNMIRKIAQLAGARKCIGRGAAENATKKERAVDSLNVLSALMTWALEGGVITADSMRSRGYGTEKRSSYQIQKLKKLDVILLSVMAVLAAAIIWLIAGGGTAADYTPIMKITPVTGKYLLGFAAYCVFLSLPTVLYIKEAIQWHISRSKI